MTKTLLTFIAGLMAAIVGAQTKVETISSGTSGDAILKIEADTDNNNESDNSRIELIQDGGLTGAYMGFNADWGGATPDNLFRIGTRYSGVDNYNRIVINGQNGNVGIGTTSPNAKLQVNSSGTIGGFWNPSNSFFTITDGGNSLIFDTNEVYGSGTLYFGSKSGDIVRFRTVTESSVSDKMTIKNNGNVGIGTTAPDSKLTVKGKIHAQEVKVTVNAGADFVFAEDYNLPDLKTLENYIKKHKHLPEIASEKEMQTNGIHLAEMNIKLLQKIEELTLYTIEQEKKIEASKKELKNQKVINENFEKELKKLKDENQVLKSLLERVQKIEENIKS